ncbi:helix-turn-helix domain-containing protein [Kangiella taiwanensis]|uniref:HTH cro/C1-type domain-containing protein n=1 Tax=Kangiella taiwanensis TaxID=1079179 RepID=A0ABP8I6W9_9GAMM|nr:helix-turn-helix transcriptional regulator [Kangiella taiwanensis]
MTLGEKLRSLRSTSGWTQPEFAQKLGIEQSYLSKLENDRSIPSVEIFDKLCTAYEITPDDMIKDLDKDYVRQKLMHIPIIANATNSKHEVAKGKRKAAVIVCSTFILVAVLFFFIAHLELLSSNKQWEYFSPGVYFEEEIAHCSKDKSVQECQLKFTGNPRSAMNTAAKTFITINYQGSEIYEKLDVGYRNYHAKRLEDKRSTANNIFLIFAVFLATLGVLGLIVEARFYRIDKQS